MTNESASELYQRHSDELIRFATVLVGPNDAADVLSDAFVSVLSSRALSSVRNSRAYLFQAVLNAARTARRGADRRIAREARAVQLVGPASFSDPAEARQAVPDALSRLSHRQRAVIFLTYWEDLTPRDTAERLGISEGAVRRHLARARTHLRREL